MCKIALVQCVRLVGGGGVEFLLKIVYNISLYFEDVE